MREIKFNVIYITSDGSEIIFSKLLTRDEVDSLEKREDVTYSSDDLVKCSRSIYINDGGRYECKEVKQ